MTVADLIRELQKQNPHDEVVIYEQGSAYDIPVDKVYIEIRKGKSTKRVVIGN
jgi:hypothetical protein